MKQIFTLILLSLFCTTVHAQNKNSILEKERAFIMSYLNKYGNRFIGEPFNLYKKPIYYSDALQKVTCESIERLSIDNTASGLRIEEDSYMWMISQLDYAISVIQQDGAISGTVENMEPFLIFTPAEKLHIREQVKIMSGEVKLWKEKDFGENSILLNLDSLRTLIGPRGLGWPDYKKKYSSGYFTFSKPIFLRNDTICIFYCSFSSGGAELSVFENYSGQWIRLSRIADWTH